VSTHPSKSLSRRVAALLLLGAAAAGSTGCELIARADRDKIPVETGTGAGTSSSTGTGGEGGATSSATGTGGAGGATSSATGTGGTGGATSSATGTGGTGGTGGATSSATGTGGTGGASSTSSTGGAGGCGDGVVGPGEQCDDGNVFDNDGCSATCALQPGYTCSGMPSVCVTTCGDGVQAGGELCDDGNTNSGDGCSPTCAVQAGFSCSGSPSACAPICGDGILAGGETCDDGNVVDGDGCSSTCAAESGYTCSGTPSACVTACGDGVKAGSEACDDGNVASGDGCSSLCQQEAGYSCSGSPSVCFFTCGNGVLDAGETCDDGNTASGDGCSSACQVEPGFNCSGQPSACVTGCGDGIPAGAEQCDDGNLVNGDGCSAACTAESGYTCSGAPSACVTACGDGVKAGGEACDDGNLVSGDGCSSSCTPEIGYLCSGGAPSVCAAICGDGLRVGAEQCDDGNTAAGDCCSPSCQLEAPNCEKEPNNDAAEAGANGSFALGALYQGAITPVGDGDWWIFTLPGPGVSDLKVETFDGTGPYGCAGVDTKIDLIQPDGVTIVATDDDSGPAFCSLIDPDPTHTSSPNFGGAITPSPAAQHLAPGAYYVRVHHFDDTGTIGAYTLRATALSTCGNGVVESTESCDDGNVASGDGCSNLCRVEPSAIETEPNDTCAAANGPFSVPRLVGGQISPAGDADWWTFTVPAYADLALETFDFTGPSSCIAIDTQIQAFQADCVTALGPIQDSGGVGLCSRLDPSVNAFMKHLAPGTYAVAVTAKSAAATFAYTLRATFSALCGNSVIEGSEQCDGGPACAADCTLLATCGDGVTQVGEQCDDGNTAAGDGCSPACQWEKTAEIEPNDTHPSADASAIQVSSSVNLTGTFASAADKDTFKLTIGGQTTVRFEILDSSGSDCIGMPVSTLKLFDSSFVQLKQDIQASESSATVASGIGNCAALIYSLAPGTYYAQAAGAAAGAYFLQVKFEADDGTETEPNNAQGASSAFPGKDVVIAGVHPGSSDLDWFQITVPGGQSIRAEIIEGAAGSCDANAVDSKLSLFNSAAALLKLDDDGGRGWCSAIDGTGASPRDPEAHALAAGTYYLQVGGYSSSFNYRLVMTVR
jgi:cysteine-rich repeat protein